MSYRIVSAQQEATTFGLQTNRSNFTAIHLHVQQSTCMADGQVKVVDSVTWKHE